MAALLANDRNHNQHGQANTSHSCGPKEIGPRQRNEMPTQRFQHSRTRAASVRSSVCVGPGIATLQPHQLDTTIWPCPDPPLTHLREATRPTQTTRNPPQTKRRRIATTESNQQKQKHNRSHTYQNKNDLQDISPPHPSARKNENHLRTMSRRARKPSPRRIRAFSRLIDLYPCPVAVCVSVFRVPRESIFALCCVPCVVAVSVSLLCRCPVHACSAALENRHEKHDVTALGQWIDGFHSDHLHRVQSDVNLHRAGDVVLFSK